MTITYQSIVRDVTEIVHAIASTHSFWHGSHNQAETLNKLEEILNALDNGLVGNESVQEITNV